MAWVFALVIAGTAVGTEGEGTESAAARPAAMTEMIPNAAVLYGLVGDGSADDTEGIQKTFQHGGPIYLPRGTFRVTQTIRAGNFTRVQGSGGHWNPTNATRILYDGQTGGVLLNASDVAGFCVDHVHFDGNRKAAIGVYWKYAVHDSIMEDCAIRNTLEHGLYVTRTWYAYFPVYFPPGDAAFTLSPRLGHS